LAAMLAGMSDVTRILSAIQPGGPHAAERLLPLVYDELRQLAAQRLTGGAPRPTPQAAPLAEA
jgi:ECF sigma factor